MLFKAEVRGLHFIIAAENIKAAADKCSSVEEYLAAQAWADPVTIEKFAISEVKDGK